MANEKNLIPQAHILTVEEQSAGGKKSAQARREKKTIQKILSDLLDSEIKDMPQFAKLASKMGVEGDKSVKDIFAMVCLLNSVKSGNLGDLERLSKLLGEDKQNENADVLSKLDKVIGEVDKLAE
jgi:hypothetical protein